MIYLDNAATGGLKPASVQNAVLASMKCCANPGRSGHRLSLALSERVFPAAACCAIFSAGTATTASCSQKTVQKL